MEDAPTLFPPLTPLHHSFGSKQLPFFCTGNTATVADALPPLAALLTQHGVRLPDGRDITAAHLRVSVKRPGMPLLAAVTSTKLEAFDFESRQYCLQVVVRAACIALQVAGLVPF